MLLPLDAVVYLINIEIRSSKNFSTDSETLQCADVIQERNIMKEDSNYIQQL